MVEYNLWMPVDENHKLNLVVRDFLEVFREIMRDSRWKDHFDLVARAIFDNPGRRLIGPPCSALNCVVCCNCWGRMSRWGWRSMVSTACSWARMLDSNLASVTSGG